MFYHENTSEYLEEWEKILNKFNSYSQEDIEQEMWEIAKTYDTLPDFNNIYQSIILDKIEYILIEELNLKVYIDKYINGRDTHFLINGEEIEDIDRFSNILNDLKIEKESEIER